MKIGLIAVGLNTYWHQFGGLRERLDGYRNAIKEKMEAYGGQIGRRRRHGRRRGQGSRSRGPFQARRSRSAVHLHLDLRPFVHAHPLPRRGHPGRAAQPATRPGHRLRPPQRHVRPRGDDGRVACQLPGLFAARILFGIQPRRHQIRRGDGLPRRRAGLGRDLRVDRRGEGRLRHAPQPHGTAGQLLRRHGRRLLRPQAAEHRLRHPCPKSWRCANCTNCAAR